jgi:glycosyltransferase involved in cell wall biosynthesis
MAEPLTTFSVIVPVHNGAADLEACLEALVGQDYPPERFEVIVVDDGSTDETAQIATRYAVRLIRLGSNRGRIVARNTGAQVARFETLVFNDVRVTPERELLAKAGRLGYEPLLPDTRDYNGGRWGFARFFHLLRCRLYAPYYARSTEDANFWIRTDNFDRAPKGLGCFVCLRERWLTNQLDQADRETSDDTRILRKIVETKPILRTRALSACYQQRTSFTAVMPHTFRRGPLFADYYLRPGGRYFVLYAGLWGFILLSLMLASVNPWYGVLPAGLILTAVAGVVVYLSRRWSDILVAAVCLPAVAAAFGLGILKWQILCLFGKR